LTSEFTLKLHVYIYPNAVLNLKIKQMLWTKSRTFIVFNNNATNKSHCDLVTLHPINLSSVHVSAKTDGDYLLKAHSQKHNMFEKFT
jgi:hypothetical protein